MSFRSAIIGIFLSLTAILTGCASTREIGIDYPSAKPVVLERLPGFKSIDGDDFYVQLVSQFDAKNDDALKQGCQEVSRNYSNSLTAAALMFRIKNESVKLHAEVPGFIYQATTGKCNFSFDAKKIYLTPWMRLDTAKATQIDYSFIKSRKNDLDFSKIAGDVNTASNVLMFTGLGTGVAVMGKLASGWVLRSQEMKTPLPAAAPAQAPARPADLGSRESHTLPPIVTVADGSVALNEVRFPIYQMASNGMNPLQAKPDLFGELKIRVDSRPSLLLKIGDNGLPDARDLSPEELWRAKIQAKEDSQVDLRNYIAEADHPQKPNLEPDWISYKDVESNCRKLKVVMKDLGFNKFDRNAVLFYFLGSSPDWRNYNTTAKMVLAQEPKSSLLQQYRAKSFAGCMSQDDFEAMKLMGLEVNSEHDWEGIVQGIHEKEAYFAAIRSIERQLVAVAKNLNITEAERQLFPLITTRSGGEGTVLLQNHLSSFGLEQWLNTPSLPGGGAVITAAQLASVFANLKIDELSCARPAFEQGKPIRNVAILLLATQADSPLARGGALEFEFDGGKITRLAFQHPAYRDYRQDLIDHPELGDCRVATALLERVERK